MRLYEPLAVVGVASLVGIAAITIGYLSWGLHELKGPVNVE